MTVDDILQSHRTRRPIVMGILNVTPDSFSDGGKFFDPAAAVPQARQMVADGADIIDIGAESTRPGSERVDAVGQVERLREVLPAVVSMGLRKSPASNTAEGGCATYNHNTAEGGSATCGHITADGGPLAFVSIDTTLSEVARFALDCGAAIINDVSAGHEDPAILALAAQRGCPIILMHMLGEPESMQKDPQYDDVVSEVKAFLESRIEAAVSAGVDRSRIIVDPGIGFGKKVQHNLALLANVDKLMELGCPVLIGASRKRFIGELTGEADPTRRQAGSIAACLETFRQGATVFRVHDVAPTAAALKVALAIQQARSR